ncbi:hypothetical protein DPMN_032360 [Dreissena polymorpha]|uniref:Uncharacterized protein n=1 Tax=Dreissena polymorpha TaxID=45954 RepID=A0A9D4M4J6_DREPO|nr:hypothetical protein DPMN_032360 [Dreissena polymorpha]
MKYTTSITVQVKVFTITTPIGRARKDIGFRSLTQSTDITKDAVYGKGTHLTKLGPSNTKTKIAKNNYNGTQQFWEGKFGKTDFVLEVKTTAAKCPRDRDVYIHEGDIPKKD